MPTIQFFENIFEERFCTFLLNNARDQLSQGNSFSRSNFHWNPDIRNSSAVVLVRDYDQAISTIILSEATKAGLVEHSNYQVMNYAWTRLSYIPWHNDGRHSEAITIYLNHEWDRDWGGLFLYEDDHRSLRACAPRFNCGLKNSGKVQHSTTPVSLDAPEPRFTVQIFPKKAK